LHWENKLVLLQNMKLISKNNVYSPVKVITKGKSITIILMNIYIFSK